MATAESHRNVLFIDDDAAFLETMSRVLGSLSAANWRIFTAETTSRAFSLLQENPIHLAVIDVQMPVMDGLQLLTLLNRRHPNLQKVILTGIGATESYRAACLANGAELFLEKPTTREAHESLFATLNELIKWQPEEGFRGVLRRVGLQDVIQMECLSRNSSVLEIKTRHAQGQIFIEEGRIVHAVLGAHKGQAAFNRLLALKGGEFAHKAFFHPPEHTIDVQSEFLLMEAAQARDEGGFEPEPEPAPGPQPTAVESSRMASLEGEDVGTESKVEEAKTGDSSPTKTHSAPGSADPSQAGLPVAEETSEAAWVAAQMAAVEQQFGADTASTEVQSGSRPPAQGASDELPATDGRRVIQEVLVCSGQGEVLYEWQCRNVEHWISFFEFLSQKSRRLAQGLVLGEFERLDVIGTDTRVVALLSPERGVMVRSHEGPADATAGRG